MPLPLRATCGLALFALLAGSWSVAHARPARGQRVLAPGMPKPLVTRDFVDVTVEVDRGALRVLKLARGRFKKRKLIRRYVGRFEVRLYSHKLLRDRIPFSAALTLAAGERSLSNIRLNRKLARGVKARTVVRVPWRGDITRMRVLDRRRGVVVEVNLSKLLPKPYRAPLSGPSRTSIFKR
ncbi:MAG: hypothetical protein KC503_27250 [Myxococcales bacterium]|nr:hypothetical protein [Myxococcales bacterium]